MKKIFTTLFIACTIYCSNAQETVNMQINAKANNEKISRFIYGHFAEHLGRCIYGGFYVTDSINVPKQGRIRMDVVNALKEINIPLDKVMLNIERLGNTIAGTIPLCLWEWEPKLKKGDNIILVSFGGGFTWGATWLKWAYDPE